MTPAPPTPPQYIEAFCFGGLVVFVSFFLVAVKSVQQLSVRECLNTRILVSHTCSFRCTCVCVDWEASAASVRVEQRSNWRPSCRRCCRCRCRCRFGHHILWFSWWSFAESATRSTQRDSSGKQLAVFYLCVCVCLCARVNITLNYHYSKYWNNKLPKTKK